MRSSPAGLGNGARVWGGVEGVGGEVARRKGHSASCSLDGSERGAGAQFHREALNAASLFA